ncbi:MAG TPA: formylglycine-generating enzyme family protein [Thermoanaerobaculia bacterium]|jgi:formylglycine-generating enzyme required for sulfatase activity|nr:formylglycine-generating enzyme family protein [Thermoanaerobaculia bacterium]
MNPGWAATTGRADLLRAYIAGGEEALGAVARMLAYEERAPVSMRQESGLGREAASVADSQLAGNELPVAERAPVPFWVIDRVEYLAPEPPPQPSHRVEPILGTDDLGLSPGFPPVPLSLVSDARLWAAVRRRLSSSAPSRRVDVPLLAERWGRGEIAREIPFRPLASWAPRVTVLVDRSVHLIPFWHDQDRLVGQLRRQLGVSAIHEVSFQEGADRPWREHRRRWREVPVVDGARVLALGDLGFLSNGSRRRLWAAVGERQRRAGADLSAFVPCPAERWRAGLAHSWGAVSWERPGRIAAVAPLLAEEAPLARAERLLGLLSFAARIEPGLLRAVRRLLSAQSADAGTEADAWNHPEVAGGFAPAASISTNLRLRLQERFAAEPEPIQRGVVAAIRAWRAGQPEEIWHSEVLSLSAAGLLPEGALLPGEVEAAEAFWRRVVETCERGSDQASSVARAVRGFVRRSVRERVPGRAWNDQRWKPLLWRAWNAVWDGEGPPPIPEGVGPEVFGPVGEGEPIRWQVWQIGCGLSFVPAGPVPGMYSLPAAGSLLAELESGNGQVARHEAGVRWATPRPLGEGVDLPRPSFFTLRTDRTVAILRCLNRPSWANAMGRDRYGLWASFAVGQAEQRMRWIPPGRFWMGSPKDEPGRHGDEGPRHLEAISEGFWLGETPCTQALWQAVMGYNPSQFKSPARPVEKISWGDCQKFLEKLGGEEWGEKWRLPTEAEWEYACRAGTETATYAGPIEILEETHESALKRIAWYGENSGGETHPVGKMAPNLWGLNDMLGNVYEWCQDLWSADYSAEHKNSTRVFRGGSWSSSARVVRAAYRPPDDPSSRVSYLGFRLARGQSVLWQEAEFRGEERPDRGRPKRGAWSER